MGEETWKVDHCLAAAADVPLSALSRILSHPQGLEQCAQFLQSLPNAVPTTYFDTAGAMQAVAAAGDPTVAAIASPEAAAAYGLVVLRHDIADSEDNYTRFVVLSATPAAVDVRIPCKTSLILVTGHEEGALLRCLEVLSGSGHSMTKLESRPRPGRPWEYMFFLDFEGNAADPRTAAALDELRSAALFIKVLGSYPAKALRPARPVPGTCPAARTAGESPAETLEAVAAAEAPAVRPVPAVQAGRPGRPAGRHGHPRRRRARRRRRLRGDGRAVLGRERRADRRARRSSSAITARTCCAAACSSRGPRRTRSRGSAGTGWTCWSRRDARPAFRSSPR